MARAGTADKLAVIPPAFVAAVGVHAGGHFFELELHDWVGGVAFAVVFGEDGEGFVVAASGYEPAGAVLEMAVSAMCLHCWTRGKSLFTSQGGSKRRE